MNLMKRIMAAMLILLICAAQLTIPVYADSTNPIEDILGVYDGSYTATQGITGLTLSIYRKDDVLNDSLLLQKFADTANLCGSSYTNSTAVEYTAADIRSIVSQHPDEYIAFFNYFPMVDENGVGPNPDVEEGLYTMTIGYDSATGMYELTGSQWIQHDTYIFGDMRNITFGENTLSGDIYGKSFSWYQDLGDVVVQREQALSGCRIDFDIDTKNLSIGDEFEICAIVKDQYGDIYKEYANIHWFSNNEEVAVVSGENWSENSFLAYGTVTAVSEGATEIYAELDNKRIATCVVIVYHDPLEITTAYKQKFIIAEIEDGSSTYYDSKPTYTISAEITNTDINPVSNVCVELQLPDNASIYGEYSILQNVSEIAPGAKHTFNWEVVLEGDYSTGFETQYCISVKSDQTLEALEYKTIYSYPLRDNRLDFSTDVWSFTNDGVFFVKGYYLNEEHYNALINTSTNIEKEKIDSKVFNPQGWGGSCQGMSFICILTKLGQFDISDYSNTAEHLIDLPAPNSPEGDTIHSIINLYQLSTELDERPGTDHAGDSEKLRALVEAVDYVKYGGPPISIVFGFLDADYSGSASLEENSKKIKGHNVVAYDIEYREESIENILGNGYTTYDKHILIYDPNNNISPIYMHINSDYTKWQIDGYCQNASTDGERILYKRGEGYFYAIYNPSDMDITNADDLRINAHSRLVNYHNTALRIIYNNGEGVSEEVTAEVLNVFGSDNNNIVAYVNDINSDNTATSIGYMFLDDVTDVTVEPVDEGAGLDLVYEFTDVYYAVQSEGGRRVTFSEDKAFSLDCSGGYEMKAVYNEGEYSSSWYDYSITGRTDGTISMSQDADGYTIVSGDDLRNVTVTVKNRSDSETQTVSTDKGSFMITGEGDELVILTDNDDDGIYETQLEGRKVTSTATRSVDVKAIVISVVVSLGMLALFIWVYDYCKNR